MAKIHKSITGTRVLEMTDVEVIGSRQSHAVSFMLGGARYHFWLAGVQHDFQRRDILFKNPPRDVKPHAVGYFTTRRLDAHTTANKALIDHAMMIVERDGLLTKKEAEEREEDAAILRRDLQEQRLHQIQEAGPELLASLHECSRILGGMKDKASLRGAVQRAIAAIAKAEGTE